MDRNVKTLAESKRPCGKEVDETIMKRFAESKRSCGTDADGTIYPLYGEFQKAIDDNFWDLAADARTGVDGDGRQRLCESGYEDALRAVQSELWRKERALMHFKEEFGDAYGSLKDSAEFKHIREDMESLARKHDALMHILLKEADACDGCE